MLQNIRRTPIGDAAYDQLLQAIVSGDWKPGQKIPSESELTAMLGVSRGTVRNAIHKLTSLGLVESRQGQGTFICELNGAQYMNKLMPVMALEKIDIKYFLEFRAIMDPDMAALAARRVDDALIGKLKENYQMHNACKNLQKAATYDLQFHYLVAQCTRNPILIQVYSILWDVFQTALNDIVDLMGTANAMNYHKKIIEAIERHDEEAARSVMYEHMTDTVNAAASLSALD